MLDSETRPAATTLGELLRNGERALEADGDLRAGREWFDRAYRAAEADCDGAGMARAAAGHGRAVGARTPERARGGVAAGAAAQCADGGRPGVVAGPAAQGPARGRGRLRGRGEQRDPRRRSRKPSARATRSPGPRRASLAHHCLLGPDHGGQRRALAHELITEGFRTGRRSDLLMGLLWRTVDLFLDGDPHAQRGLADLRGLLAERDHLAVGFVLDAIDVMLSIRAGRFDEAEARAAACALRGEQAGDADAIGWYTAQLGAIRWFQGRVAELLPVLRETVHSPTLSAMDNAYVAGLAVAAASAGDEREAAGALARAERRRTWRCCRGRAAGSCRCTGSSSRRTCFRTSSRRVAAYALLTPFARLPMMAQPRRRVLRLGAARAGRGDADRGRDRARRRALPGGGARQPRAGALAGRGAVPRPARAGARARLGRSRARTGRGDARGGAARDGAARLRRPRRGPAGHVPAPGQPLALRPGRAVRRWSSTVSAWATWRRCWTTRATS